MKNKNQVCCWKLAEELKKLGVKQDSLWMHVITNTLGNGKSYQGLQLATASRYAGAYFYISAFTVTELLNKIIDKTDILNYAFKFCKDKNGDIDLFDFINLLKDANNVAKMLIYIIEEKELK